MSMPRRARRQALSKTLVTATIERLAHDGRGIAQIEGKTTFISGSLPGETVSFRYLSQQRRFDEGSTVEVLVPSPERVAPPCPHASLCGGCSLQHMAPEAQIALKQAVLLEQFNHIGQVNPAEVVPPLRGPISGYRHRARLGVRHVAAKGGVLVGFREEKNRFLADLTRCDVLHPSVGERIMALRDCLTALALKDRIAQIEVSVGDAQTALVLRNLDPLPDADCEQLKQFAQAHGLYLYLQPGGIDTITPLWPPELPLDSLQYALPAYGVTVQFAPNDFTQVNPEINRQMVAQALAWLALSPTDKVLDLFCGLGNFTLPLAQHAAEVVGVEGDAQLVARAQANALRQGIGNVRYEVANLADNALNAAWLGDDYSRVLLDPPRSGAQEVLQKLDLSATERLVYVSCNPATLARDAGILVRDKGFHLARAGVMDMFPQTSHVESMALFVR
jgi:23S rRNA (uracil1939-C5)-methyltransferase